LSAEGGTEGLEETNGGAKSQKEPKEARRGGDSSESVEEGRIAWKGEDI
jgi:hypothetical protein